MRVEIRPSDIESLAPMPVSVVRLAALAVDERASMQEIAEIIEYDEALTANLLRLANSVWGRSMAPILTVKDAVVRLGTAQILKFCVGRQVAGPMSQAIPGYALAEHELWRHSVAAALAAERLNSFLYDPVPRLAFTAALLHDIGKLLLGRFMGSDTFHAIRTMASCEQISFQEAERRLLGTTHAEVGGRVARYWKFPNQLVDAIERHHDPELEPDALVDIVFLADATARRLGAGVPMDPGDAPPERASRRLGIAPADLDRSAEQVMNDLEAAEKLFMLEEATA